MSVIEAHGILIEFVVVGKAEQRGSKNAEVIYNGKGQPVKKNGRILTRARDTNKKSGLWMNQVREAAIGAVPSSWELLKGPIVLTARFNFKRPNAHFGTGRNAGRLKSSAPVYHTNQPDLSKLLRTLEDALTGVIWHDDRQVCAYGPDTGKCWTSTYESTEIKIREIPLD